MPQYTTKCESCETKQLQKLSFAEYDLLRDGGVSLTCGCAGCKGLLKLEFNPGDVGFILREGPSGGWVSKSMREFKYRSRRAEVMAKRERDHVFKSELVPNYNGQEASSWKDVQDHVRTEKGVEAAATYAPHVKKESSK